MSRAIDSGAAPGHPPRMPPSRWVRACDAARLISSAAITVKIEGAQIALFRTAAGVVRAIDNRCPHEGYPLATGRLEGDQVTCEWHNWKFRLDNGACVLGGEDVRSYPARVTGGEVWIDLAQPAAERLVPKLLASLDKAFDEDDWSHAARAVQRLLAAGIAATEILAHGCDWAARRAPFGFDHGLATSADIAALMAQFPERADVLIIEALNLLVHPHVRRPERAFLEPVAVAVGHDPEGELRELIEREDIAGSEALFRGALALGHGPEAVFSWLVSAATDHFLDYGHAHIYAVKAEDLLDAIGWNHAHPVLTSLVSSIAYGTREDRLPYMRAYARAMEAHAPRLGGWATRAPDPGAVLDVDGFLAAILDGTLPDALAAVARALDARVATDRIARALALGAAHRLWRFDATLEDRDDVAEGWLDVTHLLTHADAVHESERRRPSAATLRALFHSARFIHHTAVLDAPAHMRPIIPRAGDDLADRLAATAAQAPGTLPIFIAHRIKTPLAAIRLWRALAIDPLFARRADCALPLVATERFLAHPIRERRIARTATNARTFVTTGKRDRRLLGY